MYISIYVFIFYQYKMRMRQFYLFVFLRFFFYDRCTFWPHEVFRAFRKITSKSENEEKTAQNSIGAIIIAHCAVFRLSAPCSLNMQSRAHRKRPDLEMIHLSESP